jgi:circadian clock protein KaiC
VLDSLSELRLLASDPLRFRRQILALKTFFIRMGCTVLLIEDDSSHPDDMPLRSLVHGVIELRREVLTFGGIHRRLEISKLRGVGYREGLHDYAIRTGGLVVFPRLALADQHDLSPPEPIPSGLASLDALLGGGLTRGYSCLLIGPAGIGKSTIGLQFALAAAERGEKSAIFLFDERPETALANVVGKKLVPHWKRGTVFLRQIDPAELSAGEFAHVVRQLALEEDVKLVCLDGLDGFMQGMPGEKHLLLHLHELTSFLGQYRVTTLMTKVQHGMMSRDVLTGADLTYISDAALMFRYFEFQGLVRQAVSVLKKRGGMHERTIREMRITPEGPWIGEPLEQFRGVLSGIPEYQGSPHVKEGP